MCSGNGSQVSHYWLNGKGRMSPAVLGRNQRNRVNSQASQKELDRGVDGHACARMCVCMCKHTKPRSVF